MNLTEVASFVAVVEHGTITAAARAEGVPKSTISRRIARLEEALGVQLLIRSSRSFAITDEGRLLHARARDALQTIEDTQAILMEGKGEPDGTIVISAPQDMGHAPFFTALLAAYRVQYPNVTINVRLESRYIDLVLEGVDVALRGHRGAFLGDPKLITKTLGKPLVGFYASQSYLDKHAVPSSLDDLSHHHIIAHDLTIRSSGLTFTSLSGDTRTLDFANAVLISNDYGQISGLVKEGIGVSVIPVSFTNNATLVRILPEWSARLGKISLMWPKARFIAPKIRAFIDLAVESIEPEWHEDPI